MNGWSRLAAVLAIVTAAAGLGVLSACNAPTYGCGQHDELVLTLDQLAVLDAHADDVVLIDGYSQCDADFEVASAERYYQASLGRSEVLDYYRAAARKDGWHDEGSAAESSAPRAETSREACFSKALAGTTAYLRITFPGDPVGDAPYPLATASPSGHSLYAIEVTAAYNDDLAGC